MNNQSQIEAWIEKRPFLKEVGAMYSQLNELSDANPGRLMDYSDFESLKEDFEKGIPLLKQTEMQVSVVYGAAELMVVLSRIGFDETMPKQFRQKCQHLSEIITNDIQVAKRILQLMLSDDSLAFEEFCQQADINREIAALLGWTAISHVLNPDLESIMKWQEEANWNRNYCPTCGEMPVLAHIKRTSKGRQRKLVCECCNTKWSYKRIGCPYCENDDQELLGLLEVEEDNDFRIDTCKKCNGYLKTYLKEGNEATALRDWASIHLDILSQERGFTKKGTILVNV